MVPSPNRCRTISGKVHYLRHHEYYYLCGVQCDPERDERGNWPVTCKRCKASIRKWGK